MERFLYFLIIASILSYLTFFHLKVKLWILVLNLVVDNLICIKYASNVGFSLNNKCTCYTDYNVDAWYHTTKYDLVL